MSALLECHDPAACIVVRPSGPISPLVISSPHSGQNYSPEFLAASRLDLASLRRSEDSFVDELFADASDVGAPLLAACFPRAYCDANRERWELDPDMFAEPLPEFCNTASRRVAAGFGTIARVVGGGSAIYRRKLRFVDARQRVETCWDPFHAALRTLIDEALAAHGGCLLIDCHSMPDEPLRLREPAGFVIGDAHGASCAPSITRFIEQRLRTTDLLVRRNDPYAGGYVTRHYGQPRSGIHVVQLEVARRLYMDERTHRKHHGFETLKAQLRTLLEGLARADVKFGGITDAASETKKSGAEAPQV